MGIRLCLLGSPRVEQEGDRVTFDTRKALALLAYLAVTANRHRREALANLLWPEYEQHRAYANLRRTLWSLKQGIGEDALEIDTDCVALKREDLWLDVETFRAHLSAADAHYHDDGTGCLECLESLQAAVAHYEGDFLSGFTMPNSPPFDE